jgi:hypothetical protein
MMSASVRALRAIRISPPVQWTTAKACSRTVPVLQIV